MSLSLCPWHLKAVQPAFCVASSRQSQVIDGPGNNLYESIKCLREDERDPRELLASVTDTFGKEDNASCYVEFDPGWLLQLGHVDESSGL